MCSISGFSLSPQSKINARELSHALLAEGDVRGDQASGYAYAMEDGRRGFYKNHVKGVQLRLRAMPRDAKAVILHTRYATHGSVLDNANNHPIVSQSGRIALVHNGVIWNDDEIREDYAWPMLPEVDSSVIPELIEFGGPDETEKLAGDAAIAWLDDQTGTTVHVARVSGNPIAVAVLMDGSFVFASTEDILGKALNRVGLSWVGRYPDPFKTFEESDYLTVRDGNEVSYRKLPESMGWKSYLGASRGTWYAATQGGGDPAFDDENYDRWWNERDREADEYYDGVRDGKGLVVYNGSGTGPGRLDEFYTMDHEGDYMGYKDLDILVNVLIWHAGLSANMVDVPGAEGENKWVNQFADVGHVGLDGSLLSWVANPEETYQFDRDVPETLSFVREGAALLAMLVGA
jgi:Glucosamine 6-phosphate synthetase, contains amidotransferase and phosphosugar isomerase domains